MLNKPTRQVEGLLDQVSRIEQPEPGKGDKPKEVTSVQVKLPHPDVSNCMSVDEFDIELVARRTQSEFKSLNLKALTTSTMRPACWLRLSAAAAASSTSAAFCCVTVSSWVIAWLI